MRNRSLTLLTTALLGLASLPHALAQSTLPAAAQSAADPRLSAFPVRLISPSSTPLSVLLVGIAKSAGYDVIFDTDVDSLSKAGAQAAPAAGQAASAPAQTTKPPVIYNFKNTPFNQVWPLLMDVYGLTYQVSTLGSAQIIRVGLRPIQQIIKLPPNLDPFKVTDQIKRAFGSVVRTSQSQSTQNPGGQTGTSVTNSVTSAEDVVLDSPTLKIVAEPSSNSIIVRGTNSEVLQVQALAASIVASQPRNLAPAQPEATVQRIYRVGGQQADIVALLAAQYPGLKVTPVGQTGQLILSGPQSQLNAALALLGTVDRAATVVNPAATRPEPSGQRIYRVVGQQGDISTLLTAQFPDLKVTPVGQTGQLIITGPQSQLGAALALLGTVDRPVTASGPTTVQRVFQLVNASADDVKTVLEGTLLRDLGSGAGTTGSSTATSQQGGSSQATGSTTAGTAAQATPTQAATAQVVPNQTTQATLIADKRTNTLIVRGTTAQVSQIAELIPNLDVRVPQVNVQVRIQEIGETASRSLGVDWKAGLGNFVVNIASGALSAIFDPTRSLVGFNLGATLSALEQQNLTKRVYDGSVTMQSGQRSLGATSTTENASTSAAAHIQSGGRLELNIPSVSGNITKQIDYGVTLDFFNPQVAPDGTITLRVRGVVNQPRTAITGTTLPNLLDFTNSEAQTTITFKSGETVLLSGLLGTNQVTTNVGLPYLTRLPIIGTLFGRQQTSTDRTQLLVVITGNVLQ